MAGIFTVADVHYTLIDSCVQFGGSVSRCMRSISSKGCDVLLREIFSPSTAPDTDWQRLPAEQSPRAFADHYRRSVASIICDA